jgi:hypothetical protein
VIDTLQLYQDLAETLDEAAARKLAATLGTIYSELRQSVTKEDFSELKQAVAELAQAQKRTEVRVEELAQAQKRTEERVEELAQAQKRTEERVEELAQAQKRTEERVEELAQAQKRTEERIEELAQAQKRTEERVEELAHAQKRTEDRLDALAHIVETGFRDIHNRFGVLGARWGDGAEETFRQGLLETVRELGYTVEHYQGQDPEGFINYTPRSFDLDVLVQNGKVIVAEIKSNASGADVTEFYRSVLLFERQSGRQASKRMLVAVTIQQTAWERAKELDIHVATSFAPLSPR